MAADGDAATAELDVDVLIVGGGPVGLLGGILAARHGLTALVVERRDGPRTAPAAHVVNARTYEICRQAGLDMGRIRAAGKDPVDAGHVNFVTRLAGDLIGRLPFERQGDECLEHTPTPLRNLSQHRFEPILVDELRRRRASSCAMATGGSAPKSAATGSCPTSSTSTRERPPACAAAT